MYGARYGAAHGPLVGSAMQSSADDEKASSGAGTSLSVSISDSVDPAITAVDYTYSVVVTNTGGVDATNVSCVIDLDASLAYVSAVGTGWGVSEVSGTITCTRASLAPGAAPTLTVTVTSGATGTTASTTADADADNSSPATQDTETTVVSLVSKDATSGIRVPNDATEWAAFAAYHVAIGTSNFPNVTPSTLYRFQDASGNPADSIGSATLSAAGSGRTYQQAVSGWTRLGIQTTDNATSTLLATHTSLPDISTTSLMTMSYAKLNAAPSIQRGFTGMGTPTNLQGRMTATPRINLFNNANQATGTSDPTGAVRPYVIKSHVSTIQTFYTDQEKISPTFNSGPNGKRIWYGAVGANCPPVTWVYAAAFYGSAAELSDANVKALLQALGWTIAW